VKVYTPGQNRHVGNAESGSSGRKMASLGRILPDIPVLFSL
jgi:hypothetical protein